jgi:transposase
MSRKHYPSDISREQFEAIRGLLEGAKKRTFPRQQDLYDIFCAILYLLKNAATWRALPSDFPSPSTVRYYFDQWAKVCDETGVSLLEKCRRLWKNCERKLHTSLQFVALAFMALLLRRR